MTTDPTILEMTLSPFRHLINSVANLDTYIIYNKWRWFMGSRDDFSWVYGLSEVEIEDFARQYDNTRQEIKNTIAKTDNGKLRDKLTNEYENFPTLDYKEFVLNTDNASWLFIRTFKPFKAIRKTVKFKDTLDEIRRTCERMVNYYNNVEWLELEK